VPLIFPMVGICIYAAFLLLNTWLFLPAFINALLNFWTLGILWNRRNEPPPGRIGSIVSAGTMLTSAAGLILLGAAFFVHP